MRAHYVDGGYTFQYVGSDLPASYVIVWLLMFGHGAAAGETAYWDAVRSS